jgi:poly-gamma-glutamate synthase PgsB/CapB
MQGRRVLAKTTGSRPVLIFPDGTETEIRRAGPPSIREQVRLMALASEIGADTVVAEFMSIGEECLATESRGIVRPGILALTNVRLDHLDQMGRTKEAVARTLSAAFPEGGTVFVPREEVHPVFEGGAERLRARIVPVEALREGRGDEVAQDAEAERGNCAASFPTLRHEFEPNLRLSREILTFLGVPGDRAWAGMAEAVPDFGGLRIWRKRFENPPREAHFVSAFAANDPESSAAVLEKIGKILSLNTKSIVGLLCLREDRGDRTLQWVRAAKEGFFAGFERVAILGRPAPAALRELRRRLGSECRKFFRLPGRDPGEAVDRLISTADRGTVVVGLGNIVGTGEQLVRHWEQTGVPHVY